MLLEEFTLYKSQNFEAQELIINCCWWERTQHGQSSFSLLSLPKLPVLLQMSYLISSSIRSKIVFPFRDLCAG